MIAISEADPIRNEEAKLGECLSRLHFFDEVLVVETGLEPRRYLKVGRISILAKPMIAIARKRAG